MAENRAVEIIPTCVPTDLRELARCVQKIRTFSHAIHLDIEDGIFTPAMTWPYTVAGSFADVTLQPFAGMDVHVHLMVKEPRDVGVAFSRAGAASLFGHIESFGSPQDAVETLDVWRRSGALEVGLAILLETPSDALEPVLTACDFIHCMTIATIGTQGLPYAPGGVERIVGLHAKHPSLTISVDGGVSAENITQLMHAGASRFAIGSAIRKEADPAVAYARIVGAAKTVI